MTALSSCDRCGEILGPWERRCSCGGPLSTTNGGLLYAVACRAEAPIHVRDYVRLVESDFGRHLSEPTANATLAPDRRFCWAGRGLYCLYRHGPLPGPRNLEEAARLVLVAAAQPLTIDALSFSLKRLGYRFNVASLGNAINHSRNITCRHDGRWEHARGDAEALALRTEVRAVPHRQRAAWQAILDRLGKQVQAALEDRQALLHDLGDPARFGIDWTSETLTGRW